MQLQLTTFEQAKALKDAGFDWACSDHYNNNGHSYITDMLSNFNDDTDTISRPTVALALKWLREVKGVHVTAVVDNSDSAVIYAVSIHTNLSHGKDTYPQMHVQIIRNSSNKNAHITYFDTHDLAESAGLDKGLKII